MTASQPLDDTAPGDVAPTRFERRRGDIVDAATVLINRHGVVGMTFVDVAEQVGLGTSSVTYYFRLKEQLAAAALDASLDRIEAIVAKAARAPDPRARVAACVRSFVSLHRAVWRDGARQLAVLSDIRALDETVRAPLLARYATIFGALRDLFGAAGDARARALNTVRAQVLAESLFWLPAWLRHYGYGDFDRVADRLLDLFDRGLSLPGARWAPAPIPIDREADVGRGRGAFLRVASALISERGYRGASVERIVAELNVSKGSFYHHLDAKDDLVLECFRHSYATIASAQRNAGDGDCWRRLSSTIAALLDIQLAGDWPLLRTTALHALPRDVRRDVVARSDRLALRFAGTIVDGIAEGSIRAVDPMIASQTIMAALNAARDLHQSPSLGDRTEAVATYASTLAYGLFDPPPS